MIWLTTSVGFAIPTILISVPAAFDQMQKDATIKAAHMDGIGRVALMQEPTFSNRSGIFPDSSGHYQLFRDVAEYIEFFNAKRLHQKLGYRTPDKIEETYENGELERRRVRISMDGRGRCRDNAKMERFWRALKYEDSKIKEYVSLPQLRFGVQHYVNFYNARRIPTVLGYKTPDEVYFGTCKSRKKVYIKARLLHRSFRKKQSSLRDKRTMPR